MLRLGPWCSYLLHHRTWPRVWIWSDLGREVTDWANFLLRQVKAQASIHNLLSLISPCPQPRRHKPVSLPIPSDQQASCKRLQPNEPLISRARGPGPLPLQQEFSWLSGVMVGGESESCVQGSKPEVLAKSASAQPGQLQASLKAGKRTLSARMLWAWESDVTEGLSATCLSLLSVRGSFISSGIDSSLRGAYRAVKILSHIAS